MISNQNPFYSFFFRAAYELPKKQNYLLFQQTEFLKDILNRIIAEYYDQNKDYEQVILAQLSLFFSECYRLWDEKPDASFESLILQDILSYIQSHCLTADQKAVADRFHYSTRQLTRILKEGTGKSFPRLVNGYKIDTICNHLRDKDVPFFAIVEKMGFSDVNYFYKVFQREKGISFSDYKKQHSLIDR